jgi:hypothetical protein
MTMMFMSNKQGERDMSKPIALLTGALLMLAAAAAQAQTITLNSSGCTSTYICFNVPNNAGLTIDYVDWAQQYKRLLVSIGGEIYDSGLWSVQGALQNVPLYAGNGAVISVTVNFNVVTGTCVRQGRVTVCPKTVTLTDGKIVE